MDDREWSEEEKPIMITVEPGQNLTSVLKGLSSGDQVLIKNGVYRLDIVQLPANVELTGESRLDVVIVNPDLDAENRHQIYMGDNNIIKNMTFSHRGMPLLYRGNKGFKIEGCHFINTIQAAVVENATAGQMINNTGKGSKLLSLTRATNLLVSGNDFRDRDGDEAIDFNGDSHYNTIENNTFTNASGYSFSDEAIDMIGNNTHNIVRNNVIKSNFQRGIGPRYEASFNEITGNHIEWLPGKIANEGGILMTRNEDTTSRLPESNIVKDNIIIGCSRGIVLRGAKKNDVQRNDIRKCGRGIEIGEFCSENIIKGNTICEASEAIRNVSGDANTIENNTIKELCDGTPTPDPDPGSDNLGAIAIALGIIWFAIEGLRKKRN